MSQELIKKCYRHVTEIVDKKFFEIKSEKIKKELLEKKLIIKTKQGYRFSKKSEKFIPKQMYYYNNVVGTLHEYFFAKGISPKIENIKEYQSAIDKAFLKYNYAPKDIKEKLNLKFEEINSQGTLLKESDGITKVYLNGKGSTLENIPSQADVILEDKNGNKRGISLKSHKKEESSGLINSSPITLIGEYSDLSYIKDFEQEFLDSHCLKNKSVAKNFSKTNQKFKNECNNYSKVIFKEILEDIKSVLEKEDMHHIILNTLKLKKNSKGSQLNQKDLINFDEIYDRIISLKKNIVIKTDTTIVIDNTLKLRLKYSNGNMVSSIKLQMDLLKK